MEIITSSLKETQDLAVKFVSKLKQGDVVALTGELGAGKTSFVQGLARGMGVSQDYYVNSPTFTILNIYKGGKFSIYHFDWYRLAVEAEAVDLGACEYFDGDGVSLIEWGEKFPSLLPERTIWIRMEVAGENSRRIVIKEP